MMSRNDIEGLYCIIDSAWIGLDEAGRCAVEMVEAGVKLIQLRAKDCAGSEALAAARSVRGATAGKALFIVNDRLDIAILSGADGVHLGQDDIPLEHAKRLMPGSIIGISTHNLEEAERAASGKADYISYGPIFRTKTKKDADVPKGLDGLRALAEKITIPIVAIGGITEASSKEVLDAGASSIAVISDILLSGNIKARSSAIISRTAPVLEARRHGKQDQRTRCGH